MVATQELKMDDWKTVGGYISAVVVAIIAGFWTWFSGRKKGNAEAQVAIQHGMNESQVAIQSGFTSLISELQEERKELMSVIAEQAMELTRLRGEVRQLSQVVASMERLLIKHGVQIEGTDGNHI